MPDRTKPKRTLAEGKYLRLVARGRWEWAERTNTSCAAVIIPVTAKGEMVLIDQYRFPLEGRVIELPAGLVGDEPDGKDEALLEAAKRELMEETGYSAPSWKFMLHGPSSPGMTDECYSMFLATGAEKTGEGGGDGSEDIVVHAVPLAETLNWIETQRKTGRFIDPKVYLGYHLALANQNR